MAVKLTFSGYKMNRVMTTVLSAICLIFVLQSLVFGELTPLTPPGEKNEETKASQGQNDASPILLASHQPLSDPIYNTEDIPEINSPEPAEPECEGMLHGSRWCDNNDGTVTDLTTGLTWLKNASWGRTYPYWADSIEGTNAFERAAQVESGHPELLTDNSARGDWRLPTISELKALTSGPEGVSVKNMQAFNDIQPDWYWSATDHETGGDSALNVGMHFGDVNISNKAFSYHVWPVRNSNVEQ